jgi:hypothetical protein
MIIRRRVGVTVALLALVAGCGGPPSLPIAPTVTGSAPPRSSATLPSQAEVDAALLAATDVPNGPFHVVAHQPGDSAELNTSLGQCAGSSPAPDPQVTSSGVYQGPSALGPFVAETITVGSVATITQALRDLDRVQANCAEFGGQMAGGIDLTISITPLTMPAIGDASKAFRLTASVPNAGVAIYAHLVAVRSGNVMVQIALMKYTAPTIEETQALIGLALTKVNKLRSA